MPKPVMPATKSIPTLRCCQSTRSVFGAAPEHAVQPDVAIRLIDMMRGVVDRGTGRGARLRAVSAPNTKGKVG